MPTSKRTHTISILWYICSDYLAAVLSANIFHFSRRYLLSEPIFIDHHLFLTQRFWLGSATIPFCWLILFTIAGAYNNLYQKSRLNELTTTFISCLFGCTIVFFAIVFNDPVKDYHYFYQTYFIYLVAQFFLTAIGRITILNIVRSHIRQEKVVFNTLLVGSDAVATRIYKSTRDGLSSSGYRYKGYVSNRHQQENGIAAYLPDLGDSEAIEQTIDQHDIQMVVVALEASEQEELEVIVEKLSNKDVRVKIIPSTGTFTC